MFNKHLRAIGAVLIMLTMALTSCSSASDKQFQLLEQSLKHGDVQAAYDHAVASLTHDISNTKTLMLFPQVSTLAFNAAQSQAELQAHAEQWDQSVENYQLIENMQQQILQIKTRLRAYLTSQKSVPDRLDAQARAIFDIAPPDIHNALENARKQAASFHYDQGRMRADNQDFRSASQHFEKTDHYVPGFRDASALAYRYKQLADKADATYHYGRAETAAQNSEYRHAFEEFAEAVRYVPDFRDARAQAERYRKLADEEDARRYYEQGLRLANAQNYREAAGAFGKSEQFVFGFRDAAQLRDHYTRLANEVEAAEHYQRGVNLLDQTDFQTAAQEFRAANQLVPGFRDALNQAIWAEDVIPPENYEVIRLVSKEVNEHGIPPYWFGPHIESEDLVSWKLGVVRVIQRMEFDRHRRAWHYLMYAEFSGVVRVHGTAAPDARSVQQEFILYKERDGSWDAKMKQRFQRR
ncbi:hypothetical protein FE236_08750 [Mariprofundus erugo]|uniref:hypothetical protein n=1 Tax=Mariprofundus erugo TaxID=2528639 RepID=UPI0010FEA0C1|nr:hypothetical protein [Mariprofundus erugo]TLS75820.1 hypothetical protein FE236_08750 [Mariprofundus erugo]